MQRDPTCLSYLDSARYLSSLLPVAHRLGGWRFFHWLRNELTPILDWGRIAVWIGLFVGRYLDGAAQALLALVFPVVACEFLDQHLAVFLHLAIPLLPGSVEQFGSRSKP